MKTMRRWMGGIVSKWRTPPPAPIPETTTPEKCPRCGAPIPFSRISFREMAVSIVCGGLLLSILIPAGLLAEHWVEDAGHRFAVRMIWLEPVDSWNP